MSKRRDIVLRITEYLSKGGLFNPELMPHFDVRDLLMACRDEIIAARACAEMMLQGTGQKIGEECARRVMEQHYPPQWIPVGERLPESLEIVLTAGPCGLVIGYVCKKGRWHSEHCDNETGEPYLADGEPTHWMPLPQPPEVK